MPASIFVDMAAVFNVHQALGPDIEDEVLGNSVLPGQLKFLIKPVEWRVHPRLKTLPFGLLIPMRPAEAETLVFL